MTTVYERYQVRRVINASGKMTILGGSKVSKTVGEQLVMGAQNFFVVKELQEQVGKYLADKLGVPSAYIVNSASGGIAQAVAACIAGDDYYKIMHPYDARTTKREIVLPKGHNVDYGTTIAMPIQMGGGVLVEAGFANACSIEHVASEITENTAALLYVKSHHAVQKGMPSIPEFIALGKKHQLPVIIDAAAEEDLVKYIEYGADCVIYSGTKALEGPTSGLVLGTETMLTHIKLQNQGIGRVMKVGKEGILGLVAAIDQYLTTTKETIEEQLTRLEPFNAAISNIKGLQARSVQDGAGRAIMRSEISIDEATIGRTAKALVKDLENGDIAIYTRAYRANEGKIEIDIRDIDAEESELIIARLKELIEG